MKPFDDSGAFRPVAETRALRRIAVRGAGAMLLSSGFGLGIQIIAMVTLARLLTPSDFGVVTMVTTFSLLLVNFGTNGFTEAVIQWEEIDRALASNLFWVNMTAGVVLTAGFAASGSLMARFYHDPIVTRVAAGISLAIFITSTSVVHLALLQRGMRFSASSANDVISRAVSVAVSIFLAWAGWGYWALVVGVVVQPLSQSIGAWYLCRWLPSLPRRAAGTASVVQFALHVYGRFTVNYFSRNADNLLVGWRFNAQALGFYKKAYDLFAFSAGQLLTPLSNVALSALSRLKHDPVQFRRYILNSAGVMAFVGMGLGAELTLIGKDVIRLFLGSKWDASGRIFTYFGPGIGIMFLYYIPGWIHLSIGRPDRWFRWGIVEVLFTTIVFVLGLHWGPLGIAVAWTMSFWILTFPAIWYAGSPIKLGIDPVIAVVWKFIIASLLAGCASAAIVREIPTLVGESGLSGASLRIVAISALFGAFYFGVVIALHNGLGPLHQVARLLREMVPSGKFSKASPTSGVTSGSGAGEVIMLTRED